MATSTTIPTTIDPEVAAHLAEHGLEAAFREIVEHGKRVVPGLRRVAVEFREKQDDPENPVIDLTFLADIEVEAEQLDHTIRDPFIRWFLREYPPDVLRHFLIEVRIERP